MFKTYRDIARELWSLLRSRDPDERGGRAGAFVWLGSLAVQPILLITLIVISGCQPPPDHQEVEAQVRDVAVQVVEAQKPQREEIRVTIDEVVEQAMEIGRLQEIAAPVQAKIEQAETELAELEKVIAFYTCIEDVTGSTKSAIVMSHIKNDTAVAKTCRKAMGNIR